MTRSNVWQVKLGVQVTPDTLGWLKSMKAKLAVKFGETDHRDMGPKDETLHGLKLYVELIEEIPELRQELSERGFVEVVRSQES